jgi:hypothetical protein
MYLDVCNGGGGRGGGIGMFGEHIQELKVTHSVFDQIPNLQNCFTAPGGIRQINTCRPVPLQVNF